MASLFLKKMLIRTGLVRLFPKLAGMPRGSEQYLHYLSDRLLSSPYSELQHAYNCLETHQPDAIDLAMGAPRFTAVTVQPGRLPASLRGYPSVFGLGELREAIADKISTNYDVSLVNHDEVLITSGATGAINLALETFVNRGDKVVLFDPTSQLYPLMLKQRRAKIRWIPTRMEEGKLRFHVQHLAKALQGAKMIIVANPNNPNGGVFTPKDLEQIAWWANHRDALIVNDMTFDQFFYEGQRQAIAKFPIANRRTLTVNSLSKSHAMTSTRVGWLLGEKTLVSACALSSGFHTPFVPVVCQLIALDALRKGDQVLASVVENFDSRRQYAFDRLRGLGMEPEYAAGGFFHWVPVDRFKMSGREFAKKVLQEQGVLLWPGEFFGPSGSHHVRVSHAVEEGRLRQGLTRINQFLEKHRVEKMQPNTIPRPTKRKELVAAAA
ncbi:MAG: pyridoxal phosphate-dependent aminotransferase [Gemmataceae bacterium]